MAQQVIPAAQLVPRFHTIGRCNNYAVLQSIPCSPECKIVGQILLDHPLSYALTATADVLVVVGYQGFHEQCESEEGSHRDYHSIKDDIPLVSVYTTGNVLVRGMLIPNAFLTKEIHAIDDFKEYETVFMNVDVPMNQPQPGKKRKHTTRESSSPQKSLKITIRQQKLIEEEKDDDDSENGLEPGNKEEGGEMVSLETRTEEMQTPIPTKLRSPRTILSSDKNITLELTDTVRFVGCVEVKDLVSQEFNAQELKIIEDLFKNYLQSNGIQVHPTTTTSTKTTSSANLQQQLYFKMKGSLQDRANDPTLWEVLKHKFEKSSTSNTSCRDDDIHSKRHDDHQEDDDSPKGEKRVKIHKTSKSSKSARGSSSKHSAKDYTTFVSKQQQQQQEWDAWLEEIVIDEDEVISEDETPELITKLQDVDKCDLTIFDYERMKATLNDALSNQFKNA
ncbi:hypothetical protein Tco_0812473 [Tanacetum coccineum]